ncbi:MAG: regulatory iron-sulfur-containing complex subunit RicT [bacterium]|nr:regulatory iron-sulfur-containing complex subunit RicT [bacterium]
MRLYTEFRLREDRLRLLGHYDGEKPNRGDCYRVVVDGRERFAEVTRTGVPLVEKSEYHLPCRVIGPIGEDDIARMAEAATLERRATHLFKELKEELPLKLVDVSAAVGGDSVTFFFTTPEKVDYRRLVAILARRLEIRIDMRQIGVRDEARRLGGYASCGRELCCANWLRTFDPVTIKMAKQQNLVLNPNRISGLCGRLMCCLAYEYDYYMDAVKRLPRSGSRVTLADGAEVVVRQVNAVKGTLVVERADGTREELTPDRLAVDEGEAG